MKRPARHDGDPAVGGGESPAAAAPRGVELGDSSESFVTAHGDSTFQLHDETSGRSADDRLSLIHI